MIRNLLETILQSDWCRGEKDHCQIHQLSINTIMNNNYAARIICGSRKLDHVTPLLKELHWLPIKSQLYFRDAVLAFKCMTGSAPTYLSSKFLTRGNVSGRTTRSSQLLHIPLYKTKSGQRTFYYRTVSLWNSLDNDLKLCNSSSNFKRKLRAKLFAAFLSPRS